MGWDICKYGGIITNCIASSMIFLVLIFVMEITYQIIKRRESPFKKTNNIISINEFYSRIRKGDYLVILDDMVLDMSKFRWNHPGGNFTIEQNIGRDVSKFFYGGQMLENNLSTTPYAHSNIVRLIVNTLIIGTLEKEAPKFSCKITERVSVSTKIQTMVLKTD